jgi:hypothetical protein
MLNLQWHPTLAPEQLGDLIRQTAETLKQDGQQVSPKAALYAEKPHGFSCRTCRYSRPQNATHGKCEIMEGTIHLNDGCCAFWDADAKQLYLYREPWME